MATLNSPTLGRHSVEVDGVTADSVEWADVENVPASLTSAQAAGTASIRAIGTTATTAMAGNTTATGITATAVPGGSATTVQGILNELEARIAALEP